MSELQQEAQLFAHYLIKRRPTDAQADLYAATSHAAAEAPPDSTYGFAVRHRMALPYLDAHDAFFRPNSRLRQQLYLMFSILEAAPENTELFLPRKRSGWYVLTLAGHGARAAYRLLGGLLLVKVRGL